MRARCIELRGRVGDDAEVAACVVRRVILAGKGIRLVEVSVGLDSMRLTLHLPPGVRDEGVYLREVGAHFAQAASDGVRDAGSGGYGRLLLLEEKKDSVG
jgi:hypothetical protein